MYGPGKEGEPQCDEWMHLGMQTHSRGMFTWLAICRDASTGASPLWRCLHMGQGSQDSMWVHLESDTQWAGAALGLGSGVGADRAR